MLQLNSDTLRDFLGDVFFGARKAENIKYIVPMQGNWWTPTEAVDENVPTWIGYNSVSIEPIIRGREVQNETGHVMLTTCKAVIHLQVIGKDAEAIARSVVHWDDRNDVAVALHRFAGQLMYDTRRVLTTLYFQDGQNSTLAYNVDFRFLFADCVDLSQPLLTDTDISGILYF